MRLAGVRFKERKRQQRFTQVADWRNSLTADATDARSPQEIRQSEIRTWKKDLNWVIIQTTNWGNPLMWEWRVCVRIRGKHHICLHSSYSPLGVHFWSQTVPLFSWSLLLAPYLVGLGLHGQEHLWVEHPLQQHWLSTAACPGLHHHGWQTTGGTGVVGMLQPFHCPKQHSQPGEDALPSGTSAAVYQRHQPWSLRALFQSRSCIWPKRNCSPAHKQQGLALAVLLPTPCLLADALPDTDPRRI